MDAHCSTGAYQRVDPGKVQRISSISSRLAEPTLLRPQACVADPTSARPIQHAHEMLRETPSEMPRQTPCEVLRKVARTSHTRGSRFHLARCYYSPLVSSSASASHAVTTLHSPPPRLSAFPAVLPAG